MNCRVLIRLVCLGGAWVVPAALSPTLLSPTLLSPTLLSPTLLSPTLLSFTALSSATLMAIPSVAAAAEATLKAPASAAAGAEVPVEWTGPADGYDRIHIVPVGTPDGQIVDANATYASNGSPARIAAPEEAGSHEIRYYEASTEKILARRGFLVTPVSATLKAPATAVPGSTISVSWEGPANHDDHIVVVPVGTPEHRQPSQIEWIHASPSDVLVPGEPGEYEIRYLTAQKQTTLARSKLVVLATSATLRGPSQAVAGSLLEVAWTGPGNGYDCIAVVPKGSKDERWESHAFVVAGNPLTVRAPLTPGEYELRYIMAARENATLARADVRITPAREKPGFVRVTVDKSTAAMSGAVELILDTSGSMLQRLGSRRRIDIAKETLTRLTSSVIPAGTPFALRVFGRGTDSCQTDLDIALQPLEVGTASARIRALEAKNNAKTPIGASLGKVAADLASVNGERLVILVTDGEETCGGDPAREIEMLRKQGTGVRINIVGFAVDDTQLAATFRLWSSAGNGTYFDARDAAGLNRALALALAPTYDIVDASDNVVASGVAGGDAVRVMPGAYTIRLHGASPRTAPIRVVPEETSALRF